MLPSGGFPRDDWEDPADALRSLALPVLTIAIVMSASLSRYVRSATLDVLGSDYLRTARAGGAGLPRRCCGTGCATASVPVIAILGIELSTTLLGAVVVESVFTLPGLGSMLLTGDPAARLPEHPGRPGRQHTVRAAHRLRRRHRAAHHRPAAAHEHLGEPMSLPAEHESRWPEQQIDAAAPASASRRRGLPRS